MIFFIQTMRFHCSLFLFFSTSLFGVEYSSYHSSDSRNKSPLSSSKPLNDSGKDTINPFLMPQMTESPYIPQEQESSIIPKTLTLNSSLETGNRIRVKLIPQERGSPNIGPFKVNDDHQSEGSASKNKNNASDDTSCDMIELQNKEIAAQNKQFPLPKNPAITEVCQNSSIRQIVGQVIQPDQLEIFSEWILQSIYKNLNPSNKCFFEIPQSFNVDQSALFRHYRQISFARHPGDCLSVLEYLQTLFSQDITMLNKQCLAEAFHRGLPEKVNTNLPPRWQVGYSDVTPDNVEQLLLPLTKQIEAILKKWNKKWLYIEKKFFDYGKKCDSIQQELLDYFNDLEDTSLAKEAKEIWRECKDYLMQFAPMELGKWYDYTHTLSSKAFYTYSLLDGVQYLLAQKANDYKEAQKNKSDKVNIHFYEQLEFSIANFIEDFKKFQKNDCMVIANLEAFLLQSIYREYPQKIQIPSFLEPFMSDKAKKIFGIQNQSNACDQKMGCLYLQPIEEMEMTPSLKKLNQYRKKKLHKLIIKFTDCFRVFRENQLTLENRNVKFFKIKKAILDLIQLQLKMISSPNQMSQFLIQKKEMKRKRNPYINNILNYIKRDFMQEQPQNQQTKNKKPPLAPKSFVFKN